MVIIAVTKSNQVNIAPEKTVTVTQTNHILEIQHLEKENKFAKIKKLNKDNYINLSTGEVKEFLHIENRQQNINGLRKTFKKIRYLINNNFVGSPNEKHLVLTYKENITDEKQLYKDFDKFMKALKRTYKVDYISVVEPQGRGAWHCHVLLRFNDHTSVFLEHDYLNKLWPHGNHNIKSITGVDNIGAYLNAYLTDVEITDDNKNELQYDYIKEAQYDGQAKKFAKGSRLHMYPPGMNIYRKSKGIKQPERKKMKFKEAKKITGSLQPHYKVKYEVKTDTFENTIQYLQYNFKRQNKEE